MCCLSFLFVQSAYPTCVICSLILERVVTRLSEVIGGVVAWQRFTHLMFGWRFGLALTLGLWSLFQLNCHHLQ